MTPSCNQQHVINPANCWVAVASAEHVAIGREGGFMQVGHGKGAPLKRLHAGDRVACYSSIRPLLDKLSCTAGKTSWGCAFRFGLGKVTADDMELIQAAMKAQPLRSQSP